jgi:hypothetical protein
MDKNVIYKKTAKGQEEMATRVHHLPSRDRSILVLVDGKRTGAELIDKSRHFGDGESFLERLFASGFIEAVSADEHTVDPAPELKSATRIAPQPTAPTRTRLPASTASVSGNALTETINFARHFLLGVLGPDADELAARIESSRNLKDLTQTLTRGREALVALAGRRKADEFWLGVRDRLPHIPPVSGD